MEKARRGMIGIYQIENLATGEKYVGSSSSMNNRWKSHLTDLANGTHINKKLLNSWNAHGPAQFRFSILEIVADRESLPLRELHRIEQTGALRSGFNTKSDAFTKRTLISIYTDTKKDLEKLGQRSMNAAIQMLLQFYKERTNHPRA
jgi:group I intron endonuclease